MVDAERVPFSTALFIYENFIASSEHDIHNVYKNFIFIFF